MPIINKLSIVLPVVNERDNLNYLVPEILENLSSSDLEPEIIVVDDSSSDGTDELMKLLANRDPRIKYVNRKGEVPSLPGSISVGIASATHDFVCWMDADGSMPAEIIPRMVKRATDISELDFAIVGSRFISGGGFKGIQEIGKTTFVGVIQNLRRTNESIMAVFLSRALNRFLHFWTGRFCTDLTSGFILTRRDLVNSIGLHGSYGDYCIRFLHSLNEKSVPIIEIPYICLPRNFGESKTGSSVYQLIRRGLPYLAVPLKLRRGNPQQPTR
jgi:glycosyltransferase involved in cell wall biosynthesis